MRVHSSIATFLLTVSMSGCAADGSTQRIGGGSVDNLSPSERRLQAVENKLIEIQRRIGAQDSSRLDDEQLRLRDEIRNLRGEIERVTYDFRQQENRSKQLYVDLDERLQRLESGRAPAAAAPAAVFPPPSAAAPSASSNVPNIVPTLPAASAPPPANAAVVISAPAGNAEEEGAYLATFDLLKNGKYDEAVRGFEDMLSKWPNGRYADNAAYWMGEASYVKRDYNAAAEAFNRVISQYPQSAKVPDALYKLGLTQMELKQTDKGRATLEQVVSRFPGSNAARLAQQRLIAPR